VSPFALGVRIVIAAEPSTSSVVAMTYIVVLLVSIHQISMQDSLDQRGAEQWQ
jgi:hypothetical protein